jgi:hypothetical protein
MRVALVSHCHRQSGHTIFVRCWMAILKDTHTHRRDDKMQYYKWAPPWTYGVCFDPKRTMVHELDLADLREK